MRRRWNNHNDNVSGMGYKNLIGPSPMNGFGQKEYQEIITNWVNKKSTRVGEQSLALNGERKGTKGGRKC